MFGISAEFPERKSGSISPYFRGGNLIVLRFRCVIAHKILFLLRFHCENMAMEVAHFHGENLVEFRVAHR